MNEQILKKIARVVLRAWSECEGFHDTYFNTPKGQKILKRLEEVLKEELKQ